MSTIQAANPVKLKLFTQLRIKECFDLEPFLLNFHILCLYLVSKCLLENPKEMPICFSDIKTTLLADY